jgi:Tfp pilus assembly protein FimT
VPGLKKVFSNMQFFQSSSDLAAVLNYARGSAILDRNQYRVRLSVLERKFWVEVSVCEDGRTVFKRLQGRSGRIYSLPKEVEIYSKADQIRFYPDGRSDDVEITIKNNSKIFTFVASNSARFIKLKKTATY